MVYLNDGGRHQDLTTANRHCIRTDWYRTSTSARLQYLKPTFNYLTDALNAYSISVLDSPATVLYHISTASLQTLDEHRKRALIIRTTWSYIFKGNLDSYGKIGHTVRAVLYSLYLPAQRPQPFALDSMAVLATHIKQIRSYMCLRAGAGHTLNMSPAAAVRGCLWQPLAPVNVFLGRPHHFNLPTTSKRGFGSSSQWLPSGPLHGSLGLLARSSSATSSAVNDQVRAI